MDKIDRLHEALSHPERFEDTELADMMKDSDVKEHYATLCRTQSALSDIPEPDVDSEWESFSASRTRRRNPLTGFLRRNAAACIAVGVVSMAAIAAVVGVNISRQETGEPQTMATEEMIVESRENDTIVVNGGESIEAPSTIIFDNEPLEKIMERIGEYYGCRIEYSPTAPRTLRLYFRWNRAGSVEEIVESLNNFEQVRLTYKDNTIKIN